MLIVSTSYKNKHTIIHTYRKRRVTNKRMIKKCAVA